MVDWTHWHNEPLLIGTLVAMAWAYALAVGPWRFRIAPTAAFPRGEARAFATGLLVFYFAVGSPLDQIGERFLFSAHMGQHMVITYVVAPLVLAGTPSWLVDALLTHRIIRAPLRFATRPVIAALIYSICLSVWHVPAFYDHALRVKVVHVLQHLMFLATSLIMWWPLASRSRRVPPLSPGPQVLYIVALGTLQMPLVAFLTFARSVLYPTYEFAPRLTALTPQEDQILGGAIMGVGGMFIALGLIARAFFHWHRQSLEPTSA